MCGISGRSRRLALRECAAYHRPETVREYDLPAYQTTAEQFFGLGDEYYLAAEALQNLDDGIVAHTFYAQVTCRAHSAETYLKCLCLIEGAEFEANHNLVSLFGRVSSESRKLIKRWWDKSNKQTLKTHKFVVQARTGEVTPIKDMPGFELPSSLQRALEESKNASVLFRYSTDKIAKWVLLNFPLLVRRRILQLKPDWRDSCPTPASIFQPNPYFTDREFDGV